MISRRDFCKLTGASALATWLPQEALASPSPSIKVFGIGGAGCNIVEKLRTQYSLPSGITTITVNRADEPRSCDMKLGSGIKSPLTEADASSISSAVYPADVVVLVAGMGGLAGTNLTKHFAHAAKAANAQVVAVLCTPLSFERGRRVKLAREGLPEIARVADHVKVIDLESMIDHLPPKITITDFFAYADGQMVKAITDHVSQADWSRA